MPPLKARGGNLVEPSRHGSACGMSDERGVYGDWGESSGSSGQGTSSICELPRAGATGGSVVGNPRCSRPAFFGAVVKPPARFKNARDVDGAALGAVSDRVPAARAIGDN